MLHVCKLKGMLTGLIIAIHALPMLFAHEGCGFKDPSDLHHHHNTHQINRQLTSSQKSLCFACISIDLVIHVLSDDSGSSQAEDEWTADAINAEWSRVNEHFATTPFRFNLPQVIRTRNTQWSTTTIEDDDVMDEMVMSLRVGGGDVANVFVTDGTCLTTGGYSSFPRDFGFFPPNQYSRRDRMFVCSSQIEKYKGTDYYATIVTHELGHWMGLRHTYDGESCDESNENDKVDDTPQHLEGNKNSACSTGEDSCPNRPGSDPVFNFMNSAICRNEFTPGQAARMYASFNAYRRRIDTQCDQSNEIQGRFEIRFDNKPDENQVAFASYIDWDKDWTYLKKLEPEPHLDYANQFFARDICILKRTLYSFTVRDTVDYALDSPGYVSLTIGDQEILRESSFDGREWAATFVVTDVCDNGESLFTVDIHFQGGSDDISFEIFSVTSDSVVVSRSTTSMYTEIAYRRLFFQHCLTPGEHVFTIYNEAGNGIWSPGYYSLSIENQEIHVGGGNDGFDTSEMIIFEISSVNQALPETISTTEAPATMEEQVSSSAPESIPSVTPSSPSMTPSSSSVMPLSPSTTPSSPSMTPSLSSIITGSQASFESNSTNNILSVSGPSSSGTMVIRDLASACSIALCIMQLI